MMRDCGCHSHNGFQLSRSDEGLAQRKLISAGDLTRSDDGVTLDRSGSVSGLRRDEMMLDFDDELIDNQYRRFLNGS